jgi:hypothetical protein
LDKEVKRATARRDKAAAMLAAEDAALEALLKAQAELFEAVAEEHRVLDLHTVDEPATLKHMDASISQKRMGRPVISKHPAVARAVKLYGSVKAAAHSLGLHPSTFRSWYVEGEDARSIPDTWVDRLSKAPWNIPKSAWKKRA